MEQENKYSKWTMTFTVPPGEESGDTHLFMELALSDISSEWVFQQEVGEEASKLHYQCAFVTKERKRKSTLLNFFSRQYSCDKKYFHIDRMHGSWNQALAYCSKSETRVPGTEPFLSPGTQLPYDGGDIAFLSDKDNWYPWQTEIADILFKDCPYSLQRATDREIVWIHDPSGNSGKSSFVKYLCFNNKAIAKVSFGSASQLRSAVIDTGPKLCYIIDIPRTLGTDDSVNNLLTVIEDLKNGFVVSSFYGNNRTLMINPPHVVVFANFKVDENKLSSDRWSMYVINEHKKLKNGTYYC